MEDNVLITQFWNVYILELENNKWFLHVIEDEKIKMSDAQVILECKVLYNFVKNNPPKNIISVITIPDLLELDLYVKQYMVNYGVDNVRGGLYTDETLSSDTIKLLNSQIFMEKKWIIENQEIMETIYQKYNYDIINFRVDVKYIADEKCRLQNELMNYNNMKQHVLKMKYREHNVIIDNLIIHDIEWLRVIILCSQYTDPNTEFNVDTKLKKQLFDQRYRHFISKLREIYSIVCENNFDLQEYSPKIYLTRPDLMFDKFVYHSTHTPRDTTTISDALQLLAKFEYMIYIVINRMEEDEHTISTYPTYYERFIECSCKFLDNCL
jgi:hypothetical protein